LTQGNEDFEPKEGFYTTDAFTDVACEYISQAVAAEDDRPFFVYLAYNAPHWPLNAKWDEFQKYKGRYTDGWEALMDKRLARQQSLGLFPDDITPAPHVGPEWSSLSAESREDLDSIMAAYAACIDSIDQNLGKLVAHLESLQERDNTLILFLSDNGACQEGGTLGKGDLEMVKNPPGGTDGVRLGLAWANACNTPFRLYKHFLHEGGACTPMIASWPARISESNAGGFVRQFAYLPDFMATCLELSGASYPTDIPPCEGRSLVPVLGGSTEPVHREPIYWEHEGNAAMRWEDWKLVREYERPWELYNLAKDRTEMNNLATAEPKRVDEMIAMWELWATKNQVAYPECFNMYEFLKAKKEKQEKTKNNDETKSE
jgi:arylsulfatase